MERENEIDLELAQVGAMVHGSARVIAAERLARRVEAEGPESRLPAVTGQLVESYVWGREAEKAFVPFTRWLRLYDERSELFREEDRERLFWSFRWMVSRAWGYPQVSFEQIESTLADMERRFAEAGLPLDAVRLDQFHWAWARGADDTEERFWAWVHTPRRPEDTCLACDAAGEGGYLFETGRPAEAVRRIHEALDQGLSCLTEPANMLATLAEAHLELGESKWAARALRASIASMPAFHEGLGGARGHHIRTFARGGQLERALRHVEKSQLLLDANEIPETRMWFLVDVAGSTRLVAEQAPELPVSLPGVPARTARELFAWSEREARRLAEAFDARNRGSFHVRCLDEVLSWEPVPEPLELAVLELGPEGAPRAVDLTLDEDEPRPDPEASGAELEHRADRLARQDRLSPAASFYVQAAEKYLAEGLVLEAGIAEASAAHCAYQREDAPGADLTYRHAIGLLRAGGASTTLLAQVVSAWVPVAVETGSPAEPLALLLELRAQVERELELPETPEPQERALRVALAELLDTLARAFASGGRGSEAVALAVDAAERFAGLGRVRDAAHAFWLAGKVLGGEGREEDAADHLESAIEGFGIARERALRDRVATELVDLLRSLGRDEDADAVARLHA